MSFESRLMKPSPSGRPTTRHSKVEMTLNINAGILFEENLGDRGALF